MSNSFPQFEKTTLDSGVRIVTERIPSVRSISVGAWIYTGSRDEQPDESGISHFIEHMVFKGTEKRRTHQIAQRMESVGGYLNAFTAKEYTCYYARALDEHLARAIDTVCDLVIGPSFPEKELGKEKDVVVEEMRMYEDAPEELIFDRFESLLYPNHPMGRPVIGYEETVRGFTRDQLLGYVGRQYTPDRLVISVAGNAPHQRVVKLVQKALDNVAPGASSRGRMPILDAQAGHLTERRGIQQAHLVVGRRSFDVFDQRRVPLSVLNTIVGGGMSSRLNQNIRERYGYCYNIYSFTNLYSDTGEFGIYMGTDPGKVDRAQKLIFRELDKLAQAMVSDRMLKQAKSQVKGSIMLGLESMGSRMMRLGRQELYYGEYITLDEILEQVEAITREDVLAVAQELFRPEEYSSMTLLPEAA
ncbi:MAG: insulinase family protein [Rhodothermales bacterium]|nr:insulinase family protein [Rhodothermales bacterium]MBO6781612.1 insulinase family protein [Rhodothermales bacterium]